jgi:hypothetical protein
MNRSMISLESIPMWAFGFGGILFSIISPFVAGVGGGVSQILSTTAIVSASVSFAIFGEAEIVPRLSQVVDNMSSNMGVLVSRIESANESGSNPYLVAALDSSWHVINLINSLVEIGGGNLEETRKKIDQTRSLFKKIAHSNNDVAIGIVADIGNRLAVNSIGESISSGQESQANQEIIDSTRDFVAESLARLAPPALGGADAESCREMNGARKIVEAANCPICDASTSFEIGGHVGASASTTCPSFHRFNAHRGNSGIFVRKWAAAFGESASVARREDFSCPNEMCGNPMHVKYDPASQSNPLRFCFSCGSKVEFNIQENMAILVENRIIIRGDISDRSNLCPQCRDDDIYFYSRHENKAIGTCNQCDSLIILELQ